MVDPGYYGYKLLILRCRAAAKTRASWEKRLEELEGMESSRAQQKAAAEVAKKNLESRLERVRALVANLEEQVTVVNGDNETRAEALMDEEEAFEDESEDLESEETEEERAKRIASQWIPRGQEDEEEEPDVGDEDEALEEDNEFIEGDAEDQESSAEIGIFNAMKMWIQDRIAHLTGNVDVNRELQLARIRLEQAQKKADAARDDFYTKENALRDIEREMADLKQKLGQTYGDGDAFLSLSQSCVDTDLVDGKYTYHVCPFGNAEQKEGGRATRLGSWDGFADDASTGETVMRFSNGDSCWQGPPRSMKVTLRCGAKDSFDSVSEPSKCEYAGVVTTPAFCSEAIVGRLAKEIARRKILLGDEVDSSRQEL